MATHALATAPARTLSLTQAAENSCPFRAPKEISGVCVSSGRVPALRLNAARRDVVVHAGKRNTGPPGNGKQPRSGMQARRKQKSKIVEDDDDDAAAEKALEALFAQLEKDLNSEEEDDDGGGADDVQFTDEELAQMTKELEAAFSEMNLEGGEDEQTGLVDMVMTDGVYSNSPDAAKGSIQKIPKQEYEDDDDDEEFEDEDDDEQREVPLEKWQIRKLAAAAEKGRRNVNVKSLAAELGMDRADVLSFLKDPPPELVLMTAQWDREDEEAAAIPQAEFEFTVDVVSEAPTTATARKQPVSPPPTPSGGPQVPRSWHGNKRLKKEHIATFERVYRQSSRPSNAMVENLVNLTHVPRKKILQWFDDKRAQKQPKKQSFEEAPEN